MVSYVGLQHTAKVTQRSAEVLSDGGKKADLFPFFQTFISEKLRTPGKVAPDVLAGEDRLETTRTYKEIYTEMMAMFGSMMREEQMEEVARSKTKVGTSISDAKRFQKESEEARERQREAEAEAEDLKAEAVSFRKGQEEAAARESTLREVLRGLGKSDAEIDALLSNANASTSG